MRGLNWAEPPPLSLSLRRPWNFIPPWKENKVYTPLGLETIKVSGIDLKRRCWPRTTQRSGGMGGKKQGREKERKKERWRKGGLLRAVRSINGGRRGPAVPLATGVVNARGIPTYLRQFLFMATRPPQLQFLANWYRTIILPH